MVLDKYIPDEELAAQLGINQRTLKRYRQLKIGPHTDYVGFRPVTTPASRDAWIAAGGARGARERLAGRNRKGRRRARATGRETQEAPA
jgi:hypothetical protein